MGGGFLLVPAGAHIFKALGLPEDLALRLSFGTSLFAIFLTAWGSFLAHRRAGAVVAPLGVGLGIGGAGGALAGSYLATRILGGEILRLLFGAFAVLVGLRFLLAPSDREEGRRREDPGFWVLCGLGAGILSGLLGIGGGILFVPLMTLLLGIQIHQAVGTSPLAMLFTVGAGTLGYIKGGWGVAGLPHGSVGYVNLIAAGIFAAASLSLAPLGARLAHRTSAGRLRLAFALLLFFIGGKMLVGLQI